MTVSHSIGAAAKAAPGIRWHLIALERARLDDRAGEFMGSLLVSLGGAYEMVGNQVEAERQFRLAAELGVEHFRG